MTTHAEALEFELATQYRAAKSLRRFLHIPEVPTGFNDDLAPIVTKRLEVGRKSLVQFHDFGSDK